MKFYCSPQEYFRRRGGVPRKPLGQHFLAQPKTAEKIVRLAHIGDDDVVVEVGPGLGALTGFIAGRCRTLHLVELDRDLAEFLGGRFRDASGSVVVHVEDILRFDWDACFQKYEKPLLVVGNLPYKISSPLMFRLLEKRTLLDRAVFMVQREVGERLAAGPGSRDYGVLSVLLGLFASVEKLFTVGPKQFYPPPKVDSVVVRIRFREQGVCADYPRVRDVVHAAFQKRRKTVFNSLRGYGRRSDEEIREALTAADIDPRTRPEQIDPERFARLALHLG